MASLWDWLKIGGGAALEFVPGMQGLGTALIGSGIASAGANTAAKQQTQATQQAQQQIGQTYAPYTNLGAGAVSLLGRGLGIPMVGTAPPALGTQLTPINPGNAQGIVTNPSGPPLSNPVTPPVMAGGPLSSLAPRLQRESSYSPTSTATVRMRDPNGNIEAVPANLVDWYTKKGAVQV